jgi:sodium/bile acid cotransporter 7
VAAAVLNAVVSNVLGIVLTPAMVLLLLGAEGREDLHRVALSLGATVALPLAVGQLARLPCSATLLDRLVACGPVLCKLLLLGIVFCSFCDSVAAPSTVDAAGVAVLVGTELVQHLLVLGLVYATSLMLRVEPADRTTLLLLGSQKTLVMGLPLLKLMYANDPARLSVICLPLLVHEPLQLLVNTALAQRLKQAAITAAAAATKQGKGMEGANGQGNGSALDGLAIRCVLVWGK